ncbi:MULTISPECIES: fumarylacetoacetase [unclassified Imperialibacter]|uniref:fumarylacetoacetase n=1 Tax=unclassified Imperialibacter TaxID=2629706 RepID=UPI00125F9171|nr:MULTISPECIES: fumarylacetoacetase [unclassified Imperialibacter]CAD5250468.1 Fumarylacetoacetase [Imperialibacter sp. 75]CAD5286840.1 Fumarylacetoacetase [Imperialibacter sp. 89]
MIITANDPSLKSWVEVRPGSDFPIQNLPFGIFQTADTLPRVGVAIGDHVLDLKMLAHEGFLDELHIPESVFAQPYLNELMAYGKEKTSALRNRIAELLNIENEDLQDEEDLRQDLLVPMQEAKMLMPVLVRDYTDFYSSKEHATNVGTMFRDPANALLPNWKHLPVGYHGRASSIIVSGDPVRRPKGQRKDGDKDQPVFGPSGRLDFELEMAFITCRENHLGDSISTAEAEDYIFGFVLFNDWSARDMQAWEYVPLGPFLAKNFASSVSPWVVTLDALEPFRVAGPKQEPEVLPYLKAEGLNNFDINLEVGIQPKGSAEKVVCRSNFRHMYWNIRQQLAHHTINGCNIGVGDMYASGTISGPTPDSYGSMLELAWKGTKPIPMPDGSTRSFLQDGDTVTMRGFAEKDGVRIGFGEVKAEILPAT